MKVIDVIFGLICGRMLGFLMGDFLAAWDIKLGLGWQLVLWLLIPFITVAVLWVCHVIGRRLLFVFQVGKFVLVGAFATIIDLKFFEWLLLGVSFLVPVPAMLSKSISFLIATAIKYWGNKYWAFGQHEKENWKKEVAQFFSITLGGLLLDVAAFYYFTEVMGPQFGTPEAIWLKLSVIFAALVAALWNFSGYKFVVFKK